MGTCTSEGRSFDFGPCHGRKLEMSSDMSTTPKAKKLGDSVNYYCDW